MQSPVLSLAVFAVVVVTVSPIAANPLTGTGNERFNGAVTTAEPPVAVAPARRTIPVHQNEPNQRSDNATLLMPQAPIENLRPIVSNTVDSSSSLGKITTSSISKLVLNSAAKPAAEAAAKSGDTSPLLRALDWKGANSSQIGVPSELWCADFMNFILGQTGKAGTGSRAARSFLKYGKPLLDADGKPEVRVGAIVVLTRGNSEISGHVGIVRATDGNGNPIVISGNHGGRVAESTYPRGRIYAYVMP